MSVTEKTSRLICTLRGKYLYTTAMDTQNTPPTSHAALRALLRIIERANEQKSIDMLDDARTLIGGAAPGLAYELKEYVIGLRERIQGEDEYYQLQSDDTMSWFKTRLEKTAYGDFDEAMLCLEDDLKGADSCRSESNLQSNEFRPELFDADDRKVWEELRAVVTNAVGCSDSKKQDDELQQAINKLRAYQQKSYGPLIPTMIASYVKKVKNDTSGYSVRLAWVDEGLRVETNAPFYEQLDEFFINQSPVESRRMFTRSCFPRRLDGYDVAGVAEDNLFKHEL